MAGSRRVPRWLRVTIVTVIVLVGVTHSAGGFVFSNMIHADALTPRPPTPDHGVYVVAIGDDTITLSSQEERSDTMRPGIAGLVWPGGYGQIAHITDVDGLEVTRLFARMSGELPPICRGPLSGCDQVDIDSWAYQSDPGDLALDFEAVKFPGPLGEMAAWRIDADDSAVWAIHVHGWRASRREALRSLRAYHDAGITSLVIDYRNDEGAPDDPSNLYRFGRSEWEDDEAAVEYALENGAEQIVLVGYSTGAAIHMAFLERSDLRSRVVAAVFDSPNADMAETVRFEASKRSIPGTALPVPDSLTAVAMAIADLRWDVAWQEIDYAQRAGTFIAVPTLVFHGIEDERVPIEVSRRLRDEAPELIELVEVREAGHVTSWNVASERYEATLIEFLSESTSKSIE